MKKIYDKSQMHSTTRLENRILSSKDDFAASSYLLRTAGRFGVSKASCSSTATKARGASIKSKGRFFLAALLACRGR